VKSLFLMSLMLLALVSGAATVHAVAPVAIDPDLTIADVAHASNVRGGDLAEALGLSRQIDKQRTFRDLGVSMQVLRSALDSLDATATVRGDTLHRGVGRGKGRGRGEGKGGGGDGAYAHREQQAVSDLYNYLLWPVLLGGVLWWLLRGGRFEDGRLLPVKKRYNPMGFHATLVVVVLFFGFASGKSPNPMGGLVKYVKALAGFYEDPLVKFGFLMFFSVLALVGTKLVCGWGCPFGALQELVYDLLPVGRRNRLRLPFKLTMTVRTLLFGAFLFFAFGLAGRPWVLYHGINPFNLFGFEFSRVSIAVSVGLCLVLAAVIYRPFCQLICPFGWYAWFLEKLSLTGVRIDRHRCTGCGACDRACPVEAAHDRLEGKTWPAECFSCARCLRVCPVDAIDYGPRWREKAPEHETAPLQPDPDDTVC